jgi:hypothetical protein
MLIVTSVLPGCATIPVVTGLGWELSHVTVCPVVGASVGVQAARAGSTAQESAAVASANAEAVECKRARKCSRALTICRDVNRSDEAPNRVIAIPRYGVREPAKAGDPKRRVAVPLNLSLRRDVDWLKASRQSVYL